LSRAEMTYVKSHFFAIQRFEKRLKALFPHMKEFCPHIIGFKREMSILRVFTAASRLHLKRMGLSACMACL